MAKAYEINEKDIDRVLTILRLTDPKHATPEMAISVLEYMYATMDTMSFDNPDLLEKVIQDFTSKKK